jgi:beta-lactamase class A
MGGDDTWPLASLAKVPLALSVLAAARAGRVDAGQRLSLIPGHGVVPAAVGAGQLEHVATVALVDALYLAVSLSDTVAAEALLDLVPWTEATALLRELGLRDTFLRSRFAELTQTPAEQMTDTPELAQVIASSAALASGGHRLPALDRSRTNTSTARDLATLLGAAWDPRDTPLHSDDARHLRRLLRANVHRQRLWQEFASPSSTWASKTGTLLNLRHEAGVVEHDDGDRLAVVVLTMSSTPAVPQPYAEFVMAQAARRVHDHIRG